METPEKNFIDEHFLERLRKQRLKQAEDIENERTKSETADQTNEIPSSDIPTVNPTNNWQNDVSFKINDSEVIEESHLRSDDFLHKFNTFDNVIRYSFGTDLRNEEEDSYENDVFVQHEGSYENELKNSFETNLRSVEEDSYENKEFYQSEKGFEGEIHQFLNTVLSSKGDSLFKNEGKDEQVDKIITDPAIVSEKNNDDAEFAYQIKDYQNNRFNDSNLQKEESNELEDKLSGDAELNDEENPKNNGGDHPNVSFRSTVQPILESKKREFNILGYDSVNEDLLWKYLIEKKWKKVKEPYRLHQVVADVYTIRPNDFMNYATVEVFKKSEPRSRTKEFTLDKDSLKGLF